MIKKCKYCQNEFETEKDNHDCCDTCFLRIKKHLCVDCGKPLSQKSVNSLFINCYDCYKKTGILKTDARG